MRFVLAISALVLSGILLILGIGQTTFLAGPRTIEHAVELDGSHGIAVIPAEATTAVAGQANVIVQGVDPLLATGHNRDVQAWVAPFEHVTIASDLQTGTLTSETVRSNAEAAEAYAAIFLDDEAETDSEQSNGAPLELEVPSPAGSDLWLEQRVSVPPAPDTDAEADTSANDAATEDEEAPQRTSTVRMPIKLDADQSVLVYLAEPSSDASIAIEWVQDRRMPWAGPLLLGGAVLAVIGALLYLLAVDHDRRGLGPRRGRKGPLLGIRNILTGKTGKKTGKTGKKKRQAAPTQQSSKRPKRLAIPAVGVALLLGVTGCSPNYWPDFSPEPTETADIAQTEAPPSAAAPVPVTQAQLDRILDDIVELAGKADSSLDATGLDARFVGDALTERVANYTIRRAVSDYEVVVPRLTDESLGYQLVQSTETWPRTVFTVVASESAEPAAEEPAEGEAPETADSPSIAIIMTQANPHSNFLVSRTIALRGGITMPEAAPADEGTARLANDIQTLVMMPKDVGSAYAAVLQGGADEDEVFHLEGDTLLERSGAAWVAQSTAAAEASGQGIVYSVSAAQSDSRVISLSTGVGGALVATTVRETRVEDPGGSTWRPLVPPSITALSGLEGRQDMLVSVVSHQLLFFVPGATDGGQIELLGYTSDLIEGRNS